MANKKKNMGCLGSLFYIFFLVCAIMVLVSTIGGIIAVAGAVFIFILVIRLTFIIFEKIGRLIKKKYIEARNNGAFNFIDKIFYIFDMDNWGRENDSEEILNEKTPITELMELTDEERADKEMGMVKESAENISGVDVPMFEMICQPVPDTLEKTENHLANRKDPEHNQEEKIENINQSITKTVIDESSPRSIKSKPQYTYMSEYDMERFAIECNAYVVREERKKRQEQEQQGKEQKRL